MVEIDVAGSRVATAEGERMPYDALLLATGARPFVPPVPGVKGAILVGDISGFRDLEKQIAQEG